MHNATFDMVRTTTENSECEDFEESLPTANLKEALDRHFNGIMVLAKQKVQEITKKPVMDTQVIQDQLDLFKAYDEEMKGYVPQYLNLLKKAAVVKKKMIEVDRKRAKL